jgi:serine phosphatase RsbU (regulator of sigma subunit)
VEGLRQARRGLERKILYLSIRHKITAVLFVCLFLFTFCLIATQQYLAFSELKEHVSHDAEAAVRLAIDQSKGWFERQRTKANLLGLATERLFSTSTDLVKDFSEISTQLGIPSAHLGLEDGPYKKSAWYQKAKKERHTFFIGPVLDDQTKDYFFTFGAPLFEVNGLYVKGAVAFDVPLHDLKLAVGSVFINRVDELQVIPAQGGKFIAFVREEGLGASAAEWLLSEFKTGHPASGAVLKSKDHGQYLLSYEEVPDTGLVIYYPFSISKLMAPLLTRVLFVSVLSLLGIFIIFQLTLFLLGRTIRRIEALNESTQRISQGDFGVSLKPGARDELGDLANSFNKMTVSLVAHIQAVKESTRYKERINRELELAAELQQNALPAALPKIPGLDLAAMTAPACVVGGDYYDFLYPSEGKTGFVIADAAGKGFPGTLFMTNSRSVFRVISTDEKSPGELLKKMNNFLADSNTASGMFITVLYCVIDRVKKELTYANGGHYGPLLFRPSRNAFISLGAAGLPVGVMPNEDYESETVGLEEEDLLVLYTDGIIEAMNEKRQMFGVEPLKKLMQENFQLKAQAISTKIEDALKRFVGKQEQFDDMTLMVMKVGGENGSYGGVKTKKSDTKHS